MAKPNKADSFLALYYGALIITGLAVFGLGLVELNRYGDARLLALGLLATIVPAALFPIAIGLRAAGRQAQIDRAVDALGLLSERILTSDAAKSIAYRHQERDMLHAAIREDIDQGDFDGALTLVTRMSQIYGYREQAEDFRDEIEAARAAETERKLNQSIEQFDRLLAKYEWDKASAMARKIQRLFPEATKVEKLKQNVFDARERRKHQLEREFLQAAERDEVDLAMQLLQELDKYLTEEEAEPFRETARGVIGKQRDNLGVQFKLAVKDKEWVSAVRVGEQITRDFPNSNMANEVRQMIDLLRTRAAEEQAARA